MVIGRERPRQILRSRRISFQRTRTWIGVAHPGLRRETRPDRAASTEYRDRCFAFDRFGPISIRPVHGTVDATRQTATIARPLSATNGISSYFHGCYGLGKDRLWGVVRARKSEDHSVAAYKSIRAARPDGDPIYLICDNLSANKTPRIRCWAAKNDVELRLTPTDASWANPIEPQFGPLRTLSSPMRIIPTTSRSPSPCWPTYADATPTPAAPTCWPPNAVNEPPSAANEHQQRWGRQRTHAA
ncbi:hypothetical protein ACIP5Y_07095 [Nocardia sp. NPDC088792]|uniref:hypothetical protein n=1 Tax=Nocardia sp. NPDC088792 TaxID=3364332 RepID=UPI0038139E06